MNTISFADLPKHRRLAKINALNNMARRLVYIFIGITCLIVVFILLYPHLPSRHFPGQKTPSGTITDVNSYCYQVEQAVGSFAVPDCVLAVALYNDDISLCDKINPPQDPAYGDSYKDYIPSCKQTIVNGKQIFRMMWNGSHDKSEFQANVLECQNNVQEKGLQFLQPTKVYSLRSQNDYTMKISNQSGTLTQSLLWCYGF